ncbi:Threonine synthase [Burkholderiales bacterium]|jgi:threonine synthase|nr:Threonine synthase [Burkholderiales bacterium]
MQYLSTRGKMAPARFRDILLEGLAPDGGLVVPSRYPRVDSLLAGWRGLSYAELALEVLSLYADDYERSELARLVGATYVPAVFGSEEITPSVQIEPGMHLLQLSHGPTLAFKDIAMQLLGSLFEAELDRRQEVLNILGATSGDTGSAAEVALRGRARMRVFMLSPLGRMSAFQRAQMYSLLDENIFNLAIEGSFDDCQDLVKAIGSDLAFKRRHRLGAVNSINWARIVAQVVYYFRGYFSVTKDESEVVDFCVPSGNFGNVLAGWIARQMGLPIGRLVVATNENDVLDEFFRSGRYRVRAGKETRVTSSPSMDISKASNFERFIFDMVDRDPQVLRELWWQIDTEGCFDLKDTPFWNAVAASGFVSGRSNHADRLATIRGQFERDGRVLDPHTADGVKVARELRREKVPMICLETALPAKFSETIREAIGREPDRPAAFVGIEDLPQRFEQLPADLARVREFVQTHAL